MKDLFKGCPWKAPFRYDDFGTQIVDANGERALDVRGWGFLTATKGMGMDPAKEAQDKLAALVVGLLNKEAACNQDTCQDCGVSSDGILWRMWTNLCSRCAKARDKAPGAQVTPHYVKCPSCGSTGHGPFRVTDRCACGCRYHHATEPFREGGK